MPGELWIQCHMPRRLTGKNKPFFFFFWKRSCLILRYPSLINTGYIQRKRYKEFKRVDAFSNQPHCFYSQNKRLQQNLELTFLTNLKRWRRISLCKSSGKFSNSFSSFTPWVAAQLNLSESRTCLYITSKLNGKNKLVKHCETYQMQKYFKLHDSPLRGMHYNVICLIETQPRTVLDQRTVKPVLVRSCLDM